MKHFHFSIFALLFLPSALYSQQFKLEEIMKGEEFTGHAPVNPFWSVNGQLFFEWNPNNEPGNSLYYYNKDRNTIEIVLKHHASVPAYSGLQALMPVQYFSDFGDLVRYNLKTSKRETVISVDGRIRNVQRLHNQQHVCYELNGNLYLFDETSGATRQLTNFVQGTAPRTSNDTSALAKQQLELFAAIRDQEAAASWKEANTFKRSFPKAVYFPKEEMLEELTISPSGQFVTFRLSTYPNEAATYFDEHITADGFTHRVAARSKVGDADAAHRLGIYDCLHDTAYFVSFAALSAIRKRPDYFSEYGITGDYDKDRNLVMHTPVMNSNGRSALVDVRSYDNKDRWIVLLDLATGSVSEIEHQHDEAWIGGPGISGWNEEHGVLGWIDTETCYFQSEETGYSHLYTLNIKSKVKKSRTSGQWEVHDVILSKDKQTFYLIANKIHPGVRNGYKLSLKEDKLVPLFEGYFGIEWALSPDETNWAIRYSTPTQPSTLCTAANKPGAVMKPIIKSTTADFDNLQLLSPEIVQVPASDGKSVTARLYKPVQPNGAAVMFVHGAGYLQNAHYFWSNYYREFLFHQLLAEKGYTVIDIDYRASEGYGRDVRTAVYRHMGERDLLDYVDGKKFLVNTLGIDSNRVGIYGGSYGGFITLMAMMKTPGTFACGAALRSVTDWQHYNHEYTSNILNYPATDPKAYKQSSPIYFAEGLEGPLLILHGMKDDNVQFQDVVRLNQRLIELGKTNYNVAVFPTEAHGFQSAAAWTDEYRRILELFEGNLKLKR